MTSYDTASATLRVNLGTGYTAKGTTLEIQYTHIGKCADGVTPSSFVGSRVRQGQHLGCYKLLGNTSNPHLHILHKQVGIDGRPLNSSSINDLLCKPEDVYLNPLNPCAKDECVTNRSRPIWIGRNWGRFPAHIHNYGYNTNSPRVEWSERPVR